MYAIRLRRDRLVRDAGVAGVLLLEASWMGLGACSNTPPGDHGDGGLPDAAGTDGTVDAASATSGVDGAGEGSAGGSDAAPDGAREADSGTTVDATSDGTTVDAEGADADASGPGPQPDGGGGSLCGAVCGPGQMSCPSPLVYYSDDEGQEGLNYCFPQSDAGCAGLTATRAGACVPGTECEVPDGGCGPGLTNCGGYCFDTTNDPNVCGSCSNQCQPASSGSTTCLDSTCVMVCAPGWTLCGTQCSVTTADAANCGSCGHACAADEICTGAACVAQNSMWLVTGLTAPSEIQLDHDYVYWSDTVLDSIQRAPKAGGPIVTVVPPQSTTQTSLAFDDTYIYYWQGTSILRALKDGTGSPQVVATMGAQGYGLGVDSTSVYFTALAAMPVDSPPTIQSVPKAGGTPTYYATVGGPFVAATSDGLAMYVMFDDGAPHGGGAFASYDFAGTVGGPTVRGAGLVVGGPIVVDAKNVYGQAVNSVVAFDKYNADVSGSVPGVDGPYAGASCGVLWGDTMGISWSTIESTWVQTHSVGAQQLVAPGVGPVASLIADADDVYWTDRGNGAIGKLRLP